MKRKAKAKAKSKPAKRSKVSVADVHGMVLTFIDQYREVLGRLQQLEHSVDRLVDGHSGDPAAHAALGQPPADAAEVAGEAKQEEASDEGATG